MYECLAASHYRNEGIRQVRQKSTLRQEYSILFARGSRPFYTQYSTLRGGQQQARRHTASAQQRGGEGMKRLIEWLDNWALEHEGTMLLLNILFISIAVVCTALNVRGLLR